MYLNIFKKNVPLLFSFFVSLLLVFTLCMVLEPRWQTNDDVGMLMAAHGYGNALASTPNLIFSNVVWGQFVRLIPQINGVLGYSIATLGILVIVGTLIFHSLPKLNFGWLMSFALLVLIMVRPILFPQFTINAGLLTVGGIVCWYFYGLRGSWITLLTGCFFLFFGYLIRSNEFLLILLISLPILPWLKFVKNKMAWIAILILLLAIGSSYFFNYRAYQGDEWQAFKLLQSARVPINDYGADILLKNNPNILARYGYSNNDIDLLKSWFFVDSNLANPIVLNAMIKEVESLKINIDSTMRGFLGIKALINPILLPGVLAGLLLLFLLPSWRLFFVWALSLLAFFYLGLLGRPGILRVYIPVVSLVLIAPFLLSNEAQAGLRRYVVLCAVVIAALFNSITVFFESRSSQAISEEVQNSLKGFPDDAIVVWGATFPYESVFPVLKQPKSVMALKLYGLGSSTLAPYTVAFNESLIGRGMIERLISEDGVPIVGTSYQMKLLENYCREHLDSSSREIRNQQYGPVNVSWRRCERAIPPNN